jgi:small-conductance mechanosensitive channel/CRP-like cAMP-binding protein
MTAMTNTSSVPVSIYLDLAVLLGILVFSGTIFGLIKAGFSRITGIKKKGLLHLLFRLAFPLVFLGTLAAAQAIVTVSPMLSSYFDAGFFFFVIVLIIRLIDGAIQAWYTDRQKPYPLPNVLRGLIVGVIYIWVLFSILKNMLGMNISNLLTGSAILTAILGLAFQGVLGNILAGMSLHFTHSFKRGDWISLGTHEGVVVDTNWRETRLLDRRSNIVVLPNNVVAGERITNYSEPDHRTALILTFMVTPLAPAAVVLETLLEAAHECPYLITEPKPKAYILSYDQSGISYQLKYWVEDFGMKFTITTEVARLAWYKLRRRGIEVAVSWTDRFDDLTATFAGIKGAAPLSQAPEAEGTSGGPGRPDAISDLRTGTSLRAKESSVERTAEVLLGSSFLRYQEGEKAGDLMVPEAELRTMAGRVRRSAFTKGEVLFRQGDLGSSCYIVARGRIKGEIVYEENGKRFAKEFELGPGGLFGEMSLFTGMPRTATGVIAEESELLEIQAEDFRSLLVRNPEPAEAIADIVSARNAQNKDFLLKIKELSAQQVEDSSNRHSVLAYLKRFIHGLLG